MFRSRQAQGGQESLTDTLARLLPEKRKMLGQLIELDQKSRAQSGDILDQERRQIGDLRRALSAEIGGSEALDRILQEEYSNFLKEGERNRRAREAHRATKEAA